ncbi:MAG: hypothetical protein K2X47_08210 [Bdellovibrionales bacterium]|nr:hypothetical protein [Bdellovibrionales bacterium]
MSSVTAKATFLARATFAAGAFCLMAGCYAKAPKLERIEPPKELSKLQDFTTVAPRVDILFVVDDSGSMGSYQASLSSNFDLFLNEFGKNTLIDYHIGVISTSADGFSTGGTSKCSPTAKIEGCLIGDPTFVDWNTPNGTTLIKDRIMVGVNGSATEKIFDPVKLALTEPNLSGWNNGFLRPEAYLAVIFITDAEDQSMMSDSDFISFLKNLKGGDENRILSYGALVSVPDPANNCTQDSGDPKKLEYVINTFKGTFYSLCDPDYGPKLAKIAENLKFRVTNTIYLDQRPKVSTLRVDFGSESIPNDPIEGWTYVPSINAVVFGRKVDWSQQPDGTQIQVKFEPIIP